MEIFGHQAAGNVPAFRKTGKWYTILLGEEFNVTLLIYKSLALRSSEFHLFTDKKLPPTPNADFK
jgi:hypothetical protein